MAQRHQVPSAPKPRPGNPRPKPVCAGANCGGNITSSRQSLDEITCPCGYGYYDKDQHMFVPGSLVRNGQAPSREDYVAHVRQCSQQEKGAPVIGVGYVGHLSEEPQGMVYLGATGGRPQSQRLSELSAIGRHVSATSGPHHFGSYGDSDEPLRSHRSEAKGISTFVDPSLVEVEPLAGYVQLLNVESRSPNEWQVTKSKEKPGWIVLGPRQLPYEAENDIQQDTADWRKEAIRPESARVSYVKSKTFEKRQERGVISLGDDDLQKGAQSTSLPHRGHGQSTQSQGTRKKIRHDDIPDLSEGDDAHPRARPQKSSKSRDIPGRTTRKGGGYGSSDEENRTSLPKRSNDSLSILHGSPRSVNDYAGQEETLGKGTSRRAVDNDRRDSGLVMVPPEAQRSTDPSKSRNSDRHDTADSKSSRPPNRGGKYEDDRRKGSHRDK